MREGNIGTRINGETASFRPIAYRELYAPAHVHAGNTYVRMDRAEAKAVLSEARWWGFNAYGDWFDLVDFLPPEANAKSGYAETQALMDRKIASLRIAGNLGFSLNLLITPNHVYPDQYADASDLHADTSNPPHPGFYGTCLCPSKPKAREIIRRNHRRLFEAIKAGGVTLNAISSCAYDYGGCTCPQCRPWVTTFGRLTLDIHEEARDLFPGIEPRAVAWCWTPDEYPVFKEWADREARGVFRTISLFVPKNASLPPGGLVFPEGCQPHWFVHGNYAERCGASANPMLRLDEYGAMGPVIAPVRLAATVQGMRDQGVDGFLGYSEGVFDDVNKAVLGGLSSGKFDTPREILMAYAERYFGAVGADQLQWADWIAGLGYGFDTNVVEARRIFDSLAGRARRSWRLDQLAGRLQLFEAHAAVMAHSEWNASRLEAAERFFAAHERLARLWGVWVFSEHSEHEWQKEWRARYGERKYSQASQRVGEIVG